MKRFGYVVVFYAFFAASVVAHNHQASREDRAAVKEAVSELQRSMPSEKEFSELLAKADEKVSTFEAAVINAKPRLDKINTKYAATYLEGASTAHLLISKTMKNGPTAYALVSILTTLDDLSFDAASGTAFLLATDEDQVVGKGAAPDPNTRSAVLTLSAAGTACDDIAELIMHATLRFIAAEETALNKLLDEKH